MSEFSDSYHLLTDRAEQAIELFQRARMDGYVLSPTGRWTTLLPLGVVFEPAEALVRANRGTMLHYFFAEDHGWGMELYQGSQLATRHEVDWDDGLPKVKEGMDLELVVEALGLAPTQLSPEVVARLVRPTEEDILGRDSAAYQFAKLVGLQNYQWLSSEYLFGDERSGTPLPAGVLRVNASDA